MDANAVLAATLSPNHQERELAESQLLSFLSSNPSAYLASLSQTLADAQAPAHIRNAAGLAIKNALAAREAPRQEEYANRWKNLDPATRDRVKHDALATLAAPERSARNVSGQVIAAVAAVELPAGMWVGLVGQLLELASRQDNPHLRQATLQTIGYICEAIVSWASSLTPLLPGTSKLTNCPLLGAQKPEILAAQSNEILTAVVQGARKEEPKCVPPLVKLAVQTDPDVLSPVPRSSSPPSTRCTTHSSLCARTSVARCVGAIPAAGSIRADSRTRRASATTLCRSSAKRRSRRRPTFRSQRLRASSRSCSSTTTT